MHVHREGGLDVALNNCIGAREGRRKSDVTSRLFHLTFRLARPLIARDRSSRQAFVLRRTCYAFQRCSCLLVIRIYARVDRIKGFVFKGCSLWTILYRNENVTIRYFMKNLTLVKNSVQFFSFSKSNFSYYYFLFFTAG